MKNLLISSILLTSIFSVFGQGVRQGNFIIDPYYGAPNIGKNFFNSFETELNTVNFQATGIGPMGLRAEYMISDRIGVGFDFIYNSNNTSYSQVDSTFNNSNQLIVTRTEFRRTMNRIRFQARFNYHFEVSNPMLDSYIGIGAGSNNRFRSAFENGVEVVDTFEGLGNITLIPFSMRLCLGLRYYFTSNLGLNAEIGLGGPLVSAGVSLKI